MLKSPSQKRGGHVPREATRDRAWPDAPKRVPQPGNDRRANRRFQRARAPARAGRGRHSCCVAVTHVLVKKIEKLPKVTLYANLFKPNPPNSAK